MRLHFAGSDAQERFNDLLRQAGATRRLESFYSLQQTKDGPSSGFTMLLDSGGFVARTRGVEIDVADLGRFINRHGVGYAFNLDTLDPDETDANLAHLVGACPGATIIPVWHAADWPANKPKMHQLVEEHPYIGIGALVGGTMPKARKQAALDWVFRTFRTTVPFHGLGVTSIAWLQRYPWFSVDSTSWLSAARYGSRSGDERVRQFANKTQPWHVRTLREVEKQVALEAQTTRLWLGRGIDWSDTLAERTAS